jgi:hypothetical protein
MTHVYLFWIFLVLTCGYALWRGRKYERLSALVCIVASVLSTLGVMLMRQFHPIDYSAIESSDLAIDMVVLVSFIIIALASDRFWPLWVAGLQLTISLSHVMKAIDPNLLPMAYAAAERFWSYPTLLIIMLGAWRQHHRVLAERRPTAAANGTGA